jgi:hypothetical protein
MAMVKVSHVVTMKHAPLSITCSAFKMSGSIRTSKQKSLQVTIKFPAFTSIRENFLNASAKWAVEDFQI